MAADRKRRRRGANPMTTIGIVVGIHVAMGAGVLWLGTTEAGREIIHKIRFAEPPPPPPEEVAAPEIEEPPALDEVEVVEAPEVQQAAVVAPPAAAPGSVDIGSAGGGMSWSGGQFIDRLGDGPMGAFHGCVTGEYRRCLEGWTDLSARAELELRVAASGRVVGSRLSRSTGDPDQDRVLIEALQCATREFRCSLPPAEGDDGRVVTLRLAPSGGAGALALGGS